MTTTGDGAALARVKAHPVARGLGIAGIVIGLIAVVMPLAIVIWALLPGQMNAAWYLLAVIPLSILIAALGFVLSLVGLIVGFASKLGTPVAAIVGAVLNVLVLALALFATTGGFSSF
ncbi:hypothetical protein ACFJGV_09520 [Cnuibacter sp. UC19_7]|uniref:hypothetical protein n=1 Tax=Cnuibacter sp. UC19_7 TaxID=3350166 RepID=UPI00366AAF2B